MFPFESKSRRRDELLALIDPQNQPFMLKASRTKESKPPKCQELSTDQDVYGQDVVWSLKMQGMQGFGTT